MDSETQTKSREYGQTKQRRKIWEGWGGLKKRFNTLKSTNYQVSKQFLTANYSKYFMCIVCVFPTSKIS